LGTITEHFYLLIEQTAIKPGQMRVRECRGKTCPREGNADKKFVLLQVGGCMEGLYPYHTRKFCPDHPNETPD
jgi:hypothetical protein